VDVEVKHGLPCRRAARIDQIDPLGDRPSVPLAAVLFGKRNQRAVRVGARGPAGGGRDIPVALVLPDGGRVALSKTPEINIYARTWNGLRALASPELGRLARAYVHNDLDFTGEARRVVGTVSMDSFAVELDRELPVGAPVVVLGHGVLAETHAHVADTINYELVCGIESGPLRARRTVIDA